MRKRGPGPGVVKRSVARVVLTLIFSRQGIYQLETLLESAIDKHFDLYEIFVLRNTFSIPTELIPWIVLKHQVCLRSLPLFLSRCDRSLFPTKQESLVPSLSGSETLDEKAAFNEYAEELKFYEAELEKERQLACAKEWVRRKVEKCAEQAEEVGAMSGPGPFFILSPIPQTYEAYPLTPFSRQHNRTTINPNLPPSIPAHPSHQISQNTPHINPSIKSISSPARSNRSIQRIKSRIYQHNF